MTLYYKWQISCGNKAVILKQSRLCYDDVLGHPTNYKLTMTVNIFKQINILQIGYNGNLLSEKWLTRL